MDNKNELEIRENKNLTDKDFYDQACSYFYYHAGQRTTMINYFIAAFGAFLALYGALIKDYTLASMLIAVFMGVVSAIFLMIDLRNKFDVKKSENVIRQIERDYGVDKPKRDYPYGVFSNETNIMKYYGISNRRSRKKAYKELIDLYKRVEKGEAPESWLEEKILEFIGSDETVSYHEVYESLGERSIIPLSFSIKMLYYLCISISLLSFVFALVLFITK